ncbi:MAG: hypothetical protein AAGJ32_09600 [Pseudomonadota bacterium]
MADTQEQNEPVISSPVFTEAEDRARKRRNVWLGLGLAAFVVVVLMVTMVRISQGGAAMPDGGF